MTIAESLHNTGFAPSPEYAAFWIYENEVFVNGTLVTDPGTEIEVQNGDLVRVGGNERVWRELVRTQLVNGERFDCDTEVGEVIAYLEEVKREADEEGLEVRLSHDYDHNEFLLYRKLPVKV